MAELLVLAKTAEVKNAKWTRGDVIVVKPDGHKWGREERPPKFFVVRVPKAPVEDYQEYLDAQIVDTGLVDFDGSRITKMTAPRKWQLNIDSLSQATKESLDSKGIAELSSVDTKSVLTEKRSISDGNRET